MATTDDTVLELRGLRVPRLGFGTWQLEGRDAYEGVKDALDIGYRHIDGARMYGNEEEVGRALSESSVPRDELWLTTKIGFKEMAPGKLQTAADDSLRKLRLDYVDLLLLHWPTDEAPREQQIGALAEVLDAGKARAIGVSNYPAGMLREALAADERIFCDQVEFHPLLGQDRLLEVAAEHDLLLTAYSPLARGKVLEDETLKEIGAAHDKTAGQVALRWLLEQRNTAVIPKASSRKNRERNFDVFDFQLSDEERARIDALPKDQRVLDPDFAPDWDA